MSAAAGTPELHCVPVRLAVDRESVGRWLSAREGAVYAALPLPRRQREWLAGRFAAKALVRSRHQLAWPGALGSIEIDNVPAGPERGRPFYRVGGRDGSYALSISHSGPLAIAGLARQPGDRLGVDIETVEHREVSFEALALSAAEIRLLRGRCGVARWRAVTRIWVLKEALLKAFGLGLHVPLTQLTVRGDGADDGWSFEIAAAAQDRHPCLAAAGRGPLTVSTFETGGLMGAWVMQPRGEY